VGPRFQQEVSAGEDQLLVHITQTPIYLLIKTLDFRINAAVWILTLSNLALHNQRRRAIQRWEFAVKVAASIFCPMFASFEQVDLSNPALIRYHLALD
jgi:hypothetical protein